MEKDSAGETTMGILLSYYEIYNDKVFDLLETPEERPSTGLQLRDNGGKTVVVGLTERPCESLKEFETLYTQANIYRSTFATRLNANSSRSHAILRFKVTATTGDEVRVSTASGTTLFTLAASLTSDVPWMPLSRSENIELFSGAWLTKNEI